jgi:hypothetical protein
MNSPCCFVAAETRFWLELATQPDQPCCMCIAQTFLLFFAAVKQGAKTAGRVFEAPRNHVGRAPPQHCFTFQGPTRFGAVVLTQIAGFNPKLVRQRAWSSFVCVAATASRHMATSSLLHSWFLPAGVPMQS